MQAISLVDNCLELSKMEMEEWVTKTEAFSLKELLNDLRKLFLPTAETKNLNLEIVYDERIPHSISAHRESLYRILMNLLGLSNNMIPSKIR